MSKKISDYTKISKSLTVGNWKTLREALIADMRQEPYSKEHWEDAYSYFNERVNSRFLNPIRWILQGGNNKGEGFSVVALQCMLVEFLESFYQGKVYTTSKNLQPYEYNTSKTIFREFLMHHSPFSTYFTENKSADGFYVNIRCGLLHEARTKGTSLIKKNSHSDKIFDFIGKDRKNLIVYREKFHEAIVQYLEQYKVELLQKQKKALMINFIRKMDDICGIKRAYYFAYGSNLEKGRLLQRIKKFHAASRAILNDYRFLYNKKSIDGTSKANITLSEGSEIQGICYEIDDDDLGILDQCEKGYNRIKENIVILPNIDATAITYISNSIIDAVSPSKEYRDIILKGARDWKLDDKYVQSVL